MASPGKLFTEKLRPPLWLLAFIYFLFLSFALSVWAALGNLPGIASLLVLTLLLGVIAQRVTMAIIISE